MWIKKLSQSFKYAGSGLWVALCQERNMRIHMFMAILVLLSGYALGINRVEFSILIITIGFVLTAELFNSSIETIIDLISPNENRLAGQAKDIAAGAVLCSAIAAIGVGLFILGPRILIIIRR